MEVEFLGKVYPWGAWLYVPLVWLSSLYLTQEVRRKLCCYLNKTSSSVSRRILLHFALGHFLGLSMFTIFLLISFGLNDTIVVKILGLFLLVLGVLSIAGVSVFVELMSDQGQGDQ